jgi:hypothetical protein
VANACQEYEEPSGTVPYNAEGLAEQPLAFQGWLSSTELLNERHINAKKEDLVCLLHALLGMRAHTNTEKEDL